MLFELYDIYSKSSEARDWTAAFASMTAPRYSYSKVGSSILFHHPAGDKLFEMQAVGEPHFLSVIHHFTTVKTPGSTSRPCESTMVAELVPEDAIDATAQEIVASSQRATLAKTFPIFTLPPMVPKALPSICTASFRSPVGGITFIIRG
jgi:hypothetical protein